MPLYEGDTLQARLDRGRISFEAAFRIALQVAGGLGRAHESGIVHLDVKPSNIIVLPDGTAKVLDFGIARIHDTSVADPQTLIGTIPYMSPEQATAGPVDCRSDIWSLGIVIHEMLAGERPFKGADRSELVQGDPQPGSHVDRDVLSGRAGRDRPRPAPDARESARSALRVDVAPDRGSVGADDGVRRRAAPRRASDDLADGARMSATERRRAAVLVTVVSDYAGSSIRNTPSEAQRLIALLRDTAVDVVREVRRSRQSGHQRRDRALFGVPTAHDDDDLRAVRAALELHARVRALSEPDGPSDVTLGVQSGLHVGPVVARRLQEGPRRFDIVGAPATVAARLAALADPGSVFISPETQRLVGPYMHTAACSSVALDSQGGPVTPFRVLGETGVATRLEASSRTGLTPYVGRQPELSMLEAKVNAAPRERKRGRGGR